MAILQGTFAGNGQSVEFSTAIGDLFVSGQGTFGSGALAVQLKLADGTWQDIDTGIMAVFTAAGDKIAQGFPRGVRCRLDLTGSTAPDLDYQVVY